MMLTSPVQRAWALTFLWVAVIAAESCGGSAQNTAGILYPLLKWFFPELTAAHMGDIHFMVRKAGHFFGYAILSFLLYRAWWTTLRQGTSTRSLRWRDMFRDWSWRAAVLGLLCTLMVAGSDEWHQSFSPGRTASVADVALDESGGFLAQTTILLCSSVTMQGSRRRKLAGQPATSA